MDVASTALAASSSSPPSSSTEHWKYDVFLSFRGIDTRQTFTDHLYWTLKDNGVNAYIDENELRRGENIPDELKHAIERSRISVIVFSKRYADSTWCLEELEKIMECRRARLGQMVLPVFYDVDPTHVRKQTGSFAQAFRRHEERFREDKDKVQRWRYAFTEAANLAGANLRNTDGYEGKFIRKIVDHITRKLNNTCLDVATNQIGIESRVREVSNYLNVGGSDDVRIIGIWGMVGMGKTAVAKAIFNKFHQRFEGKSFLSKVRKGDMVKLQNQLLCDILKPAKKEVRSIAEGTKEIKKRLSSIRALVIIDDVDCRKKLDELAIKRDSFGSGSRIIITTTNAHFLRILEVDDTYFPPAMSNEEALQLLCCRAFTERHPSDEEYLELSRKVVEYCGGLPLALEVLGSYLCKRTKREWRSALRKLKRKPHGEIQEKLKLGSHHFIEFASRTKLFSQLSHPPFNPAPNLVFQIRDILCDPQWEKSSELSWLSPKIRTDHVSKIIETHKNTDSALRFFYWVSKRPSYQHDMSCFSSMLNRLVNERLFAPADRVRILMIKASRKEEELKRVTEYLNEMSRLGFEFTLYSFNTLLIQLGKFEMISIAQNVYTQVLSSGIKPSLLTFNTMLNILCKKGKVQEAELILSKIFQFDMLPDVFTYTSLILGHCRNRNLDLAFEVYDQMVKAGCDPNSVTYSTLINGLCNEGRVDEALDMLDEMVEKGIEPTSYTYTVPIASLCEADRLVEAIGLFRRMRSRGCHPTVHTYTALISGLSQTGKLDVAIGLYHKLLKDGLVPNTVTFNTLINGLSETGRYDLAQKIFYWVERHGTLANTQTHNEIIKVFCLMGNINNAMALVSKMLKVGPSLNVITYNTLINGYLSGGQLNNAMRLLDFMKGSGCEPDEWTYTELISGFCKAGKTDFASTLFREMVEQRISPSQVTYAALIAGYCMEGKVDTALSLFEQMEEKGCCPSIETYNAIINGLSKDNQFVKAEKLCKKMEKQGLVPNVITYTSLICGLCKSGRTDLAFKIFHEMEEQGCLPNLYTYSSLMFGLCQEGKADNAETLLDEMERKGLAPDVVTFTTLIDGFVMLGRLDHAFLLLRRMVDVGCRPNYRTYAVLVKGLQKESQLLTEKVVGLVAQHEGMYSCSSGESYNFFEALCNLLARMSENGCEPTVDTYGTLVRGLCTEGRYYEADQLVQHMKDKGLCPNRRIYLSLFFVHCTNLKVESALEIFGLMEDNGFEVHLSAYNALISALGRVCRAEEAETLFKSMLEKQWNTDEIVWTVLIDGLLKEGQSDLCMKLLHVIESQKCSISFQTYDILARELSKVNKGRGSSQIVNRASDLKGVH